MEIKFEILQKGDTVLNVYEQSIVIKKKNGEVQIYNFHIYEDGLPRLNDNSILITFGNKTIKVKTSDESSVEVGTF